MVALGCAACAFLSGFLIGRAHGIKLGIARGRLVEIKRVRAVIGAGQ